MASKFAPDLGARRPAWAAWGAIAALLLVFFVQTFHKAARPDGNDLTSYLSSSRALLEGRDPYTIVTPYPYVYPLFLAFLLIPLALLPAGLAVAAWFLAAVASLFLAGRVLVTLAGDEIGASPGTSVLVPGLLALLLLLSPIQNDLLNGQVNLIVLVCCVLFVLSYLRGRPRTCAIWLAAAIALKLLPAILLLFLLIRRQLRLVLLTLFLAALFCLLPGILAGPELFGYYRSYLDSFVLASLAGKGAAHAGARIAGLHGAIAHLAPEAGRSIWVKLAAAGVSVAAIVALDATSRRSRPPGRDLWPFCAYLLGALLVSPIVETHHLVLAIPAVLLLGIKAWLDRPWVTPRIRMLGLAFIASVALARWSPKAAPLDFVALTLLLILVALARRPAVPLARS